MTLIEIPRGYRANLVAVTAEDDQILRALERTWEKIRTQDERIPAVVFEIGPGRESSCTSIGWDQVWPVISLNLLRDGRKITGAELLERLLHFAAHAIAGPQMTSEGRYHPRSYRDAGVILGLDVKASDPETMAGDGWSQTSLAPGTGTTGRWPMIEPLDRALRNWEATEQPKTERADSRNGVVLACSCTPETLPDATSWPRTIRLRGSLHPKRGKPVDVTGIFCKHCGQDFRLAD